MTNTKSKIRFGNKKTVKVYLVLILTITTIFIVFALVSKKAKSIKYIAYVGRNSTALSKLDGLQISIFNDFISHINTALSNYRIELLTFNIGNEPRGSDSVYTMIVKEKDILFTIDNTFGNDIRFAQQKIKENNLPVFFINADKNNRDYGNAAIFTGNDDNLPYDLAAFLRNIKKANEINFVSESDYLLQESFFKAFAHDSIKVKNTILIRKEDFSDTAKERVFKLLAAEYKKSPKKIPLIINTHADWGFAITEFLEKEVEAIEIIGGAYIVGLSKLYNFGVKSRNRLIIAGEPTDALSESMLKHLDYLENKYPKEFNWPSAPYFAQRCLTIIEFIENYIKKHDRQRNMSLNTAILFQESLKNTTLEGKENLLTIDSSGILKKETSFTNYQNGRFYSLPLHISQTGRKIPNMIFGMDIIDIHNVDINDNTFAADYFYWIRIDTSFRANERDIVFQNIKQDESSRELIMEKVESNSLYKLFKVSAKFSNDFSLTDYPLDKQEIKIQVDILKPADSLKISFDQRSIEQNPELIERFNVPGWNKLRSDFTIDNRISRNMRGAFEEDESLKLYKSLNFRLNLKRKITKPILEIILPLFFIGISSIALLFIKDLSFSNIGEVSVGILLAIITFSIAMAVIIPTSDYLTKADWFFWITFLEVLTCFLTMIYLNYRYTFEELQNKRLTKLRFILLLIFLLSFAIVIIV